MRSVPPVFATYDHTDFDLHELVAAKNRHVVSVCLPARDEESTVGAIVTSIKAALVDGCGLVDEILVVDDHSTDRTASVAAAAGARVTSAASTLRTHGDGHGKGAAMWKSLAEARGDLIVWCDADVIGFEPHFVTGLLGPLLTDPHTGFVKGYYERPSPESGDRGGRVTELVARPMLALLFPHLSSVVQPLSGEYAGRRELLEQLSFVEGYGVDIAMLIDIADRFGTDVIAQVDLGTRIHRNRPLDELSPQATAVIQTMLSRASRPERAVATLYRPGLDPIDVEVVERPPLASIRLETAAGRGLAAPSATESAATEQQFRPNTQVGHRAIRSSVSTGNGISGVSMSATQSNEPQPGRRPGRPASTHRLAELVVHLTDCSADQAIAAVEAVQDVAPDDADEALQVVARAISSIRRIDLRDAVDLRDQAEEQTPIA